MGSDGWVSGTDGRHTAAAARGQGLAARLADRRPHAQAADGAAAEAATLTRRTFLDELAALAAAPLVVGGMGAATVAVAPSAALAGPPPPGSCILVIAGQSNGYGFADPARAIRQPYRGRIWNCAWPGGRYEDGRCDWTNPAREPIHTRRNRGHGSAMYAANRLIETGKCKTVITVPCGHGGTLADWQPGRPLWNACTKKIARARPYGHFAGLLWAPGGADAVKAEDAARVTERMDGFLDALRARYATEIPVVLYIMATKPPNTTLCCWDQVRDQQINYAKGNLWKAHIAGKPLYPDGRHLRPEGYLAIGREAADMLPGP